jgi:hypothetical protein
MNTSTAISNQLITSYQFDLANCTFEQVKILPTIVDNDIVINEFKTDFDGSINITFEDNSNYDLNFKATFHQVDDEWYGTLVNHVEFINKEKSFLIDMKFKQLLQGLLSLDEALLDKILQSC